MSELTDWKDIYEPILKEEKMVELRNKMKYERAQRSILPQSNEVMNAFKLCPFNKLKVVIIGADPYPSKENAHGLAFSSNATKTPASLGNIFKEINAELYPDQVDCFKTNNLTSWAQQGVLLLNRVLTVVEGESNSHKDMGWEYFTSKVIETISTSYPRRLIFVLWGSNAREVETCIDHNKHYVLHSAHPSPLSAHKGFFGNNHFKLIQAHLRDIFFEGITDQIIDKYDWRDLSSHMLEWFKINNIVIEEDNLIKTIKFMNSKIGDFLAINDPEINKLYELDFKT